MANKPRNFPKLRRGEGSWHWNAERRQIELKHVIDGRRYTERADTPARCQDLRDERRRELAARPDAEEEEDSNPNKGATVAALIADWLGFVRVGAAPKTVAGFERSAELIVGALGQRVAAKVGAGELERFLRALVTKHDYAEGTLARRRTHLFMIFAHGVRHRFVDVNPVPQVVTPGVAKEDRKPQWLDESEFAPMRQYLVANPTTINTMFLLMLLTGVRPGEATGLCWDAIDWKRATMEVQSAVQHSGHRQSLVKKLKTKQSNRTVELPPDLVRALHRERSEQAARRLLAKDWVDLPVAFTREHGRLISSDLLALQCKRVCSAVGTKRISPNGFRHTNASMLLLMGASPADVAKHLGHKDMTMVIKHYGHSMRKTIPTAALLGGM